MCYISEIFFIYRCGRGFTQTYFCEGDTKFDSRTESCQDVDQNFVCTETYRSSTESDDVKFETNSIIGDAPTVLASRHSLQAHNIFVADSKNGLDSRFISCTPDSTDGFYPVFNDDCSEYYR
jgi:hypothetical protein